MITAPFVPLLLLYLSGVSGLAIQKRDAVDFYDPTQGGGRMFSDAYFGLEPLNVIISGRSDPKVLTEEGFLNYAKTLGFSKECLGLHIGDPQSANLGDGNGPRNQAIELREDFSSGIFGTCLQSVIGGNHFRMWRQDGQKAQSGALFLAVSKEKSVKDNHDIVDNGYNIGRDELVANAIGTKTHDDISYHTISEDIHDLMPTGSDGLNHGIAVDGVVKLLTVTIQK